MSVTRALLLLLPLMMCPELGDAIRVQVLKEGRWTPRHFGGLRSSGWAFFLRVDPSADGVVKEAIGKSLAVEGKSYLCQTDKKESDDFWVRITDTAAPLNDKNHDYRLIRNALGFGGQSLVYPINHSLQLLIS